MPQFVGLLGVIIEVMQFHTRDQSNFRVSGNIKSSIPKHNEGNDYFSEAQFNAAYDKSPITLTVSP